MQNKKPVTIKDLASELGLSDRAVSQALNPRQSNVKLGAKTVERIKRLAALRNYRPNLFARAMRARRFFNIGYFEARAGDGGYSLYSADSGIYHAATDRGYHITMVRLPLKETDVQAAIPRLFKEAHLDALVVAQAGSLSRQIEKAIDQAQVPAIYLNQKRKKNAVYNDDEQGAGILTGHLIERGYRRILHVHSKRTSASHYSIADRSAGYQRAMANAGLESLIFEIQPETWPASFVDFIRTTAPDAIFVGDTCNACRLFRALYAAGIRIPDDIAMAAYGEDWFSMEFPVPLTTMSIPYMDIARAAVEMAISMVETQSSPAVPSVIFPAHLEIKDSTPYKAKR